MGETDIDESMIVEIASEIKVEEIYKKVFEVYDIKVNSFLKDHTLQMKKAEFIFLKKEYTAEDKVGLNYNTQKLRQYMKVLTETHNNMLQILQNPRNEFIRMEENPLHSKDI